MKKTQSMKGLSSSIHFLCKHGFQVHGSYLPCKVWIGCSWKLRWAGGGLFHYYI